MNDMRKLINLCESFTENEIKTIIDMFYNSYMHGEKVYPQFNNTINRLLDEYNSSSELIRDIDRTFNPDMFEATKDKDILIELVYKIATRDVV